MDTISNKELKLWIDIISDNYKAATNQTPSIDILHYLVWSVTGLHIAKSKIAKIVKPFKKHGKKSLIGENNKIIKVIRKRKQTH